MKFQHSKSSTLALALIFAAIAVVSAETGYGPQGGGIAGAEKQVDLFKGFGGLFGGKKEVVEVDKAVAVGGAASKGNGGGFGGFGNLGASLGGLGGAFGGFGGQKEGHKLGGHGGGKVVEGGEVVVIKEEKSFDLGIFGEWVKLIFNPIELIKQISIHFNIPAEKFIEKLGKDLVLGVEAILHPLVATIKIIENVFEADHCRLKLVCSVGTHLDFVKSSVLSFSPQLLEGSHHIKALSDGIAGKECHAIYPNCEPKLKKPYASISARSGRPEDSMVPPSVTKVGETVKPVSENSANRA